MSFNTKNLNYTPKSKLFVSRNMKEKKNFKELV